MGTGLRCSAAVVGWLVISMGSALAVAADDTRVLQAEELVAMLAGTEATNLAGVTVLGDVDLGRLEQVARPLRCRDCRFTGSFQGIDLILERIVDFSGSVFEGPFDMSAALFRDRAGFEEVVFAGPAVFGSARFLADASFGRSEFQGPAGFDRIQFGAAAGFSGSTFAGDTGFERAQFAMGADFAGARFRARSSFADASFARRVSFARAEFAEEASFTGAFLGAGGNFGVQSFSRGCSFEGVNAAGSTEFLGAGLAGEGVFNNFSSTGTLALDGIRMVGADARLFLDRVAVSRFTMDVDQVNHVAGPAVRKEALAKVEQAGRESGDLALANRARFRLLDLEGADKQGFARLWDRLILRNVGGYLVRPINPLVTLLVLVLIGGLIRSARSLRHGMRSWWAARPENGGSRGLRARMHRGLLISEKAVARLLSGISRAMNVAVRRKPDHIKLDDPERARSYLAVGVLWGEFLVYKLMIAVFLLALGNSNATVRQLLDAVTG